MTARDGGTGETTALEGETVLVRRQGAQVHAWCETFGVHASASSADEAIRQLDAKLADLARFEAQSGLDVSSRIGTSSFAWRKAWRRLGVPVLIGGLVALQLGWALSVGIANGVGRALDVKVRDGLIANLERQMVSLASSSEPATVEQQRRLIEAARALRARYGPVWDELVGAAATAGR